MTIVLFELETSQRHYFKSLEDAHSVVYVPDPLSRDNVSQYSGAEIISTFNLSETSTVLLSCLPKLRHIVSRTTGLDHLPMDYCRERGISISYIPHYGQNTVAEYTFGMLLALAHHFPREMSRPRLGDFIPRGPAGFDLAGKTLGVIGTGNIGRHVIRIAQGFGMRVLAHDIAPNRTLSEELGFPYVSKETVVSECDILTLHVPGDDSTYHLIGESEFERMRPGAILINTARGTVVDIMALSRALLSGILGGACLDVLPHESILRDSAQHDRSHLPMSVQHEIQAIETILAMPNVVSTSHMGFNTREALERIMTTACDNIHQFLATVVPVTANAAG